ncbi:hypothetical protein ACJX0J_037277, partial [Zea mays]
VVTESNVIIVWISCEFTLHPSNFVAVILSVFGSTLFFAVIWLKVPSSPLLLKIPFT